MVFFSLNSHFSSVDIELFVQSPLHNPIIKIRYLHHVNMFTLHLKHIYSDQGVYTKNFSQSWGGLNLGIFVGRVGVNGGSFPGPDKIETEGKTCC